MLDLITRQPGITADALAASLALPSSYAFEIALYLQSTGAIVSRRTGWHRVQTLGSGGSSGHADDGRADPSSRR